MAALQTKKENKSGRMKPGLVYAYACVDLNRSVEEVKPCLKPTVESPIHCGGVFEEGHVPLASPKQNTPKT